MRTINDNKGLSWRVWRITPQSQVLQSTASGMSRGWLCFESQDGKRRLVDPPRDWESYPESRLLELLEQASPVRATAGRS
jgi:hypothetical protein